jgi:hypothetical protein
MIDAIIEIVCAGEKKSKNELVIRSRSGELVFARQLIFYFCHELKLGSDRFIGSKFGMDHVTVLHSAKVIKNYIDTDKLKAEKIREYWKTILRYKDKESAEINIFVLDSTLQKDLELTNKIICDLERKLIAAKAKLIELQETVNKLNS